MKTIVRVGSGFISFIIMMLCYTLTKDSTYPIIFGMAMIYGEVSLLSWDIEKK